MAGDGYPMVATHDPPMVDEALRLGTAGAFEFQMLYGIRPLEQERLAAAGHVVRTYVPYGDEWYGYLMRRLAERPANLVFFLRALVVEVMTTDRAAGRRQARRGAAVRAAARGTAGRQHARGRALPGAGGRGGAAVRRLARRRRRRRPPQADVVLLAVKPQDMRALLVDVAPSLRPGTLVVSMAAGITAAFVESHLSRRARRSCGS